MKNRLFHNWILKLTSVVCAIMLWIVVYAIDDTPDDRYWYNVPIKFINTELITENGQVYEVLNEMDTIRYVKARAAKSIINDLGNEDINVEADFSKMKMDGTIELNIYSSRHNGSVNFTASSEEVKVKVEERKERYLSLHAEVIGKPFDGYMIGSTKLAQNRIMVSGAESIVDTIDKAVVVVDVTGTSEDVFSFSDIIFFDADGKEVSTEKLQVSMNSVSTTVEILPTKTVPIRYELEGTTLEGFVATGEVVGEYNEVQIAGKKNILNSVDEIVISKDELVYENASEDVELRIDIDDYLPSGITRVNKNDDGTMNVVISVEPIVERKMRIPTENIEIINMPEGYTLEVLNSNAEVEVVVQGGKHIMEALKNVDIQGTIDVMTWMEKEDVSRLTNMEIYKMTVECAVSEGVEVIETPEIAVIVKIKEE